MGIELRSGECELSTLPLDQRANSDIFHFIKLTTAAPKLFQLVDFHRFLAHLPALLRTTQPDISAQQQRGKKWEVYRRYSSQQLNKCIPINVLTRGRFDSTDAKLFKLFCQHHVLAGLHSHVRALWANFGRQNKGTRGDRSFWVSWRAGERGERSIIVSWRASRSGWTSK